MHTGAEPDQDLIALQQSSPTLEKYTNFPNIWRTAKILKNLVKSSDKKLWQREYISELLDLNATS